MTEFLLLKALAQRPGHVKSRDQLMDAAYGENIYVDDRTIDSHIKRLRKKFKAVDTSFDVIETLYGGKISPVWETNTNPLPSLTPAVRHATPFAFSFSVTPCSALIRCAT